MNTAQLQFANPPAPGGLSVLYFLLLLLTAAGLQSVVAAQLMYLGAYPDFALTVALSAALLSDTRTGCWTGLAAGLVTASVVGRTVGTYLVSRLIAGYVAGGFTRRLYRGNLGVAVVCVFVGSIVAEVVYALSAPPRSFSFLDWSRVTLTGAGMNALLALPITFMLRRAGWGRRL